MSDNLNPSFPTLDRRVDVTPRTCRCDATSTRVASPHIFRKPRASLNCINAMCYAGSNKANNPISGIWSIYFLSNTTSGDVVCCIYNVV